MSQRSNPYLKQIPNAPKRLTNRDAGKIQQVFDELAAKFNEQSLEELVELFKVNSKLSSKKGRMSSTGLAALEFAITTKEKIAEIEALKQENKEQKEMVRILKEHADKNQVDDGKINPNDIATLGVDIETGSIFPTEDNLVLKQEENGTKTEEVQA